MRRLATALLFLLALAAPARADNFMLEFDGAWLGVAPLGKVRLDMAVGEDGYAASTRLTSSGLLRLFEPTDLVAAASGAASPAGLQWRRYDLDHSYSKKRRVTSLRLSEDRVFRSMITPSYRLWGQPPASAADKASSHDPLTALTAMAVDVARTGRCAGVYPTFDGRFRYDLTLFGGEAGQHRGGGYTGPVLRCRMRYTPVAGYEPRDDTRPRRLPEGEIWFARIADSNLAPPVRVSVPLPLGRAVISLNRMRRARVDILEDDAPRPATADMP